MIMDAINTKDVFNQLLGAVCAGDSESVRRLIAEAREKGGDETVTELFAMRDDVSRGPENFSVNQNKER